DRLKNLKAERDRAKAALEACKHQIAPGIRIDPALIERFGRSMREKFTLDRYPFRKAYLQSLIDALEVDDHHIRIRAARSGWSLPSLHQKCTPDVPRRNVICA